MKTRQPRSNPTAGSGTAIAGLTAILAIHVASVGAAIGTSRWQEHVTAAGATAADVVSIQESFGALNPAERAKIEEYWETTSLSKLEKVFRFRHVEVWHDASEATPKPLYSDAFPVRSPESLLRVSIPNTTINAVTVDPKDGSCHVVATVTHPPANDQVKVFVALPMRTWNGRLLGIGGMGFAGGQGPEGLGDPVAKGFASATTDTGHEGSDASFTLDSSRRLNWQEIRDFAYLGVHDMTIVGKALTESFYGKPARYSYFKGNSTGGRQGIAEAERYPADYDGIVVGSPAINMNRFASAMIWPQVVMLELGDFVSKAKFDAVNAALISACDGLDGTMDGFIDNPIGCKWDPEVLVGTSVGGAIFTKIDAEVVREIWKGPHRQDGSFMWYGLPRGADLSVLAATAGSPLRGKPEGLDWIRYCGLLDPDWQWTTITRGKFELLWNQMAEQYGEVLGNEHPDLKRFRELGHRLIIFHGLADPIVPVEGSIAYYERLQTKSSRVADFVRLFLAPGYGHGYSSTGPTPVGEMDAIIRWVEAHEAPDQLKAIQWDPHGKVIGSRLLDRFPGNQN